MKRKNRSYEGILALLSWAEACRKFGKSSNKKFVFASLCLTQKNGSVLLGEARVKYSVLLTWLLNETVEQLKETYMDGTDSTRSCSAKPSGGVESFGKSSYIWSLKVNLSIKFRFLA